MRLIDADAFIEYLGEIVTLEDFDRQPTAYDVDKVVERLRKEISDCMCDECDRHTDCDTCRAEKAVEIENPATLNNTKMCNHFPAPSMIKYRWGGGYTHLDSGK